MKKQILHLINSLETGGAETQILNILENAGNDKYRWHLGFLIGNGELLKGGNQNFEVLNLSVNGKFSFRKMVTLFRYIKKNNISIIHTHLVQAGIIGYMVGKSAGAKVFIYTRHHLHLEKENSLIYRIFRVILNKYDRVVCVSEPVYNLLLNKGLPKEKLTVIYNGIAKDFIAEEKSDNFEANSLVSTGRLVEAKGFDILIKAVYLLKTEYNLPVNCYIIGDGPEKKNLRELAESLKVSDNIHFPGKMERHALIQTLIKKHLYVSASRFEGFNLALLEAMALKLPVISTKTGIAEEAIIHTENGILIEKENKHALAEAVYTLIKTPLLAEKIAVKGRETVINNYMIEKTISRLLELYGKY